QGNDRASGASSLPLQNSEVPGLVLVRRGAGLCHDARNNGHRDGPEGNSGPAALRSGRTGAAATRGVDKTAAPGNAPVDRGACGSALVDEPPADTNGTTRQGTATAGERANLRRRFTAGDRDRHVARELRV